MFNLTKFKQWQVFFGTLSAFVGGVFYTASMLGISAMEPDLYGDVAVSGPIWGWALIQISGGGLLSVGAWLNGRWRWSCFLRMGGALILVSLMMLLAASSFSSPNGWPIGVLCGSFGLWGVPVIWWNLVDFIGSVRWGGDNG